MAVTGQLSTMPLTDLLQWAATTRKTGSLRVERHKVSKRIHFERGRVVACSSDAPTDLLGQFLLSQGKIDEEQLRAALERQEVTGESISQIFVSLGILSAEALQRTLVAKAQEVIYSMFGWGEAHFRFDDKITEDPYKIEVELDVQDVLLKGLERYDEMKRFREVFVSEGVVLQRTAKPVPATIANSRMAKRILESVNGDRTLAEVLLHAHASEYLVTKFLFQLQRKGFVEVKEVRELHREEPAALEAQQPQVVAAVGGSPIVTAVGAGVTQADSDLAAEVQVATRFMDRGEYDAALEVLNASYRANPGESLRQLMAKAEAEIERIHQQVLAPHKIPKMIKSGSTDGLSPEAAFLPSLIDGKADIKSILWLAPMRSPDVLRALKQMLDQGLIELVDPS